MSATRSPRVALISLEAWDEVWRRNQHLVAELLRQELVESVVFIEPPARGIRAVESTPLAGVRVVRPPLVLPRRLGGLRLAGRWLRGTALGSAEVLWINDPALGVHCRDDRQLTVYDVTDDWRCTTQPPRIQRRLIQAEDRLAQSARIVVCSAELARRWRSRYDVVAAVVQNAAVRPDTRHIDSVALQGDSPHVGYVGTLQQERLDLDLTVELARSEAVGTVHLVGPDYLSDEARARLTAAPKIRIEPPVPSASVPAWIAAFDVLVAPHVLSPFTLSLDAIKAFEYLASDRPVVATATSGFQDLAADGLDVAAAEDFVASVDKQLASNHRFARTVPTWADRAQEFASAAFDDPGVTVRSR